MLLTEEDKAGDAYIASIAVASPPFSADQAEVERHLMERYSGMLEPVFYVSPEVDYRWMVGAVRNSMNIHMNFMDSGSLGASVLPLIHRIAGRLGLRPPLWRHTRFIRRGLRFFGMEV